MLSPSNNREQVFFGSGYGYDERATTAGWVGGGIAFLFLVFIIFGIAFFLHSRHDGVEANIREGNRLSGPELIAAATERGAQTVRGQVTLEGIKEVLVRLDNLSQFTAVGLQRNNDLLRDSTDRIQCTTRESAQGIVDTGRTFGFRTFDVVRPDPCRDRGFRDGCDGRGRDFARLHGTFALPTASTPGTVDAEIRGGC